MLFFNLNRNTKTPLTKQIFEQLRSKILKNELKSGDKLPSTRKLAGELKVSRNIIIEVYEQMLAEGYLISRKGSGTFVADGISLDKFTSVYTNNEVYPIKSKKTINSDIIEFATGVPDLRYFPRILWAKYLKEGTLDIESIDLDYPDIQGLYELRVILARYLLRTKGINTSPSEIYIVSGSAEAFNILSELFKLNHNKVIIEDPSYNGILKIIQKKLLDIIPVAVDELGITTSALPANNKQYNIIITPSHQFPTGVVLPVQRRIELIKFATQTQSLIIENDYDSEFRFTSTPINSLHFLNRDIVFHIGTFSETMFPALRIGYMVVPIGYKDKINRIKSSNSMYTSSIKQFALMNFIQKGHYERHIAKMKKIYHKKRLYLINILKEEFGENVIISGDSTGLFIVVEFPGINITEKLIKQFIENNVEVYPVKEHILVNKKYNNKILLGFGSITEKQIDKGIRKIKNVLGLKS